MSSISRAFSQCRWVPWAIAACFVVIATVNGALAYFALHSDTGLVSAHPFELGNDYNRVLAAGAAADALGWRGRAEFVRAGNRAGTVVVRMRDARGVALEGLSIKAALVRPIEPIPEVDLTLVADGGGVYRAPATLSRAGQWELRVSAARGSDVYQFAERIVVP